MSFTRFGRGVGRVAAAVVAVAVLLGGGLSARAGNPGPNEQYMLELINRMRADPQGELGRLVNINPDGTWGSPKSNNPDVALALNFFGVDDATLKSQWATLTPAPPLAWSAKLHDSAVAHSQLMIANDAQSHQLPGEPGLIARFAAAGYTATAAAENIFAFGKTVDETHAAFAIDWGGNPPSGIQDPPGHRNTIMSNAYREVGVAILSESNPATSVGPLVVTQHFGSTSNFGGPFFLTGVAYRDPAGTGRYTLGSGIGGATVTVRAAGTANVVGAATTFGGGGYTIQVPTGTYDVTFAADGVGSRTFAGVAVGFINVKLDWAVGGAGFAPGPITAPIDLSGAVVGLARTGDLSGTLTVNYSATAGTATAGVHFTPVSGTVTFAAGSATAAFVVPLAGTATPGGSPLPPGGLTVQLTLTGAGVPAGTTATLTITPPTGAGGGPSPLPRYRLYLPAIQTHLYTTNPSEYAALGAIGWTQEGSSYKLPAGPQEMGGVAAVPVYRVYIPSTKRHLWTTSLNEYTTLNNQPSVYTGEGIDGYMFPQDQPAPAGTIPLFRLYNPTIRGHLWTTDSNEYATLQTTGWNGEGVAGYVLP
jgi:hypothetical protein